MSLALALIAFSITHSTCLFVLLDPILLEGLTLFVLNKHHLGWPTSQVLSGDLESISRRPVNIFIITNITASSLTSAWGRNQDLYLLNLHNPHNHPETELPWCLHLHLRKISLSWEKLQSQGQLEPFGISWWPTEQEWPTASWLVTVCWYWRWSECVPMPNPS